MIKIIAAIRRKPGMTHSEYLDYIENVHGTLARAEPLGVARYVQNHVYDAAYGLAGDDTHLTTLPRDSVTELWFADFAALGATFSHEYTRTVVGPDGKNFSDLPSALSMMTQEVDVFGAGAGQPGAKVMFFLKAAEGVDDKTFEQSWMAAANKASQALGADLNGSCRSIKVTPPAAGGSGGGADYFGGHREIRYDGVQSLWFAEADAVATMRRWEAAFCQSSQSWLDRSRSFWLLAREVQIMGG